MRKEIAWTTLFLVGILALVVLSMVGCGESGGVSQPTPGSPAASAQESFEVWAQQQGNPYPNVRYTALANDGTFAKVQIVAEFRLSAESSWIEQAAQVECRKVGNIWQCEEYFYFSVTPAQETREAEARQATAVRETQVATSYQATAMALKATLAEMPPIAFTYKLPWDNDEIYVINANGSNLIRVVENSSTNSDPTWSPDGRRIAFICYAYSRDIYVVDADGSNLVNLSNDEWSNDISPAWSPDGQRIAFSTDRDDNDWEVYVMNADGSNPVNFTNNSADDEAPAWSPDGRRIAFMSYRDGNSEIYVIDADGSNPANLTNNPADDHSFAWSPDGQRIVFLSNREPADQSNIYVMDADGSNVVSLGIVGSDPTWSPDGQHIAFDWCESRNEICVMNADGSNVVRLSRGYLPSWSPDGQWIAFDYVHDAVGNIGVINIGGGDVVYLTDNQDYGSIAASPAWAPRRP